MPCQVIKCAVVENDLVVVVDDDELAKLSREENQLTLTIKFVGTKDAYSTASTGGACRSAPTQRELSVSPGVIPLGSELRQSSPPVLSPTSSTCLSPGSSLCREAQSSRGHSRGRNIRSSIASTGGLEDERSGTVGSTFVSESCESARDLDIGARSQSSRLQQDRAASGIDRSGARDEYNHDIDDDNDDDEDTPSSAADVRSPTLPIIPSLASGVRSALSDTTPGQGSPGTCHSHEQSPLSHIVRAPLSSRDRLSVTSYPVSEHGVGLDQSVSTQADLCRSEQHEMTAGSISMENQIVLNIRDRLGTVWSSKRETKAFREKLSQLNLSSSNLDDCFNFQPNGPDFVSWLTKPNLTTGCRREIEVFRLVYQVDFVEKVGRLCVPNFVDFATSGYKHLSDLYPYLRLDYEELDPNVKGKWQDSMRTSLQEGFIHRIAFQHQPGTALTISAEIQYKE